MKKINEQASFSLFDLLRLIPVNVLADYRAARHAGRLGRELLSIPLFRYNQFWGTYRGYNGPCEVTAELKDRFYYPAPHKFSDPEPAELAPDAEDS